VAPVSLYGATKLASETVALEYGETFGFPVWVDRSGVLAGAGQFGTAEQGIFSYWIHSHRARRPLRFCGFGCAGLQVRDALHPDDLADLLAMQMRWSARLDQRVFNVGGGIENSTSLARLAKWCDRRFGAQAVAADSASRPFDVPWVVMDSRRVRDTFGWQPARKLPQILDEIAVHAEQNPNWLELAGV
jgi:CDP-paratose 2-epimerase